MSFVRVSDEPIEGRGPITHPDAVVLADPTVSDSKVFPALSGLAEGAVVIVNAPTGRGIGSLPSRAVYFDVSGVTSRYLKKTSVSAGIAAATCKVLGIAGPESLHRAVEMEMEEIGLDEESIRANLASADECYSLSPRVSPSTKIQDERETDLVELSAPTGTLASISLIVSTGNSSQNRTGDWRLSKPTIDYAKCTKCMVCYVYCPDSAITLKPDLTPTINYDNCKGCMICMEECPPKAISEERSTVSR